MQALTSHARCVLNTSQLSANYLWGKLLQGSSPAFSWEGEKERKYLLDTRYLTEFNFFPYFQWKWKPLLRRGRTGQKAWVSSFSSVFSSALQITEGWEWQHFLTKQFDPRHGGYSPCSGLPMHPWARFQSQNLWKNVWECVRVCASVCCVWEPGLVLSSPAHSCDLVLACFRCCSWAYAPLSQVKPSLIYEVLVFNMMCKKNIKAETLLIPAPSPLPPSFVGNRLRYKILPSCPDASSMVCSSPPVLDAA